MIDEWILRTEFHAYRVRLDPFGAAPEDDWAATVAVEDLISAAAAGNPKLHRQLAEIRHRLDGSPAPFAPRGRRRDVHEQAFLHDLRRTLASAAQAGTVVVENVEKRRVIHPPEEPEAPLGPQTGPGEEPTYFEARIVDEIGEPISGLDVVLTADGKANNLTTDGDGKVRLDGAKGSFGSLRVTNIKSLRDIVEPRWTSVRPGKFPSGNPMTQLQLTDDLDSVSLEDAVLNLIVITPPLGKLYLELFDRTGRVRHANRKYSIDGPMTFDGVTDEAGQLLHEEVLPGDYTLTLTLDFFEDSDDPISETYDTPVVALDLGAAVPQQRMLGAVPVVVFARARGFLFDTNKTFLLPTAIEALQQIRDIYEQNEPSELLIVGHTDTTGEPSVNDPLSRERAESVKAYLTDDVDAWLKNYDASGKKKWGSREDRLMITAMPDFPLRDEDEDLVEWFQRTRELTVDGKAGPKTRKQLVTEYMALDGTSLKDDEQFQISITTHGCGENYPLDSTGMELDQQAADGQDEPMNRRAELFFFDAEFGIRPKPGKADGPEYLEWRKAAEENQDFVVEPIGHKAIVVEVHDALFRTNSCVVLPEGEVPDSAAHASVTSVGIIASLLRFNEEHPGRKLFIAGHTDTTGDKDFNQKLSEERAQVALALLEGDRDTFGGLVDARHKVADYKQILSWMSQAFEDVDFDCNPGAIDDNAATGVDAVRRFQAAYNDNKQTIGAEAQPDLDVDGDIGPNTWKAIFDVYQYGIAQELGEDDAGMADLRSKLAFVDPDTKFLGFGELHPIDHADKDNYRSQTNRRVELLLFERGEEPDLALAKSDPDITELYLPGTYAFEPVAAGLGVKKKKLCIQFVDPDGQDLGNMDYRLETNEGVVIEGSTPDATIRETLPSQTTSATLLIDGTELKVTITEA